MVDNDRFQSVSLIFFSSVKSIMLVLLELFAFLLLCILLLTFFLF